MSATDVEDARVVADEIVHETGVDLRRRCPLGPDVGVPLPPVLLAIHPALTVPRGG